MMRRRGSSLLFVILILTVVTLASLVGVRVLLSNSRQSASYDASERARQMARAGIEEAVARLKSADGRSAIGEYGVPAGGSQAFSLEPVRMTYSDPSCEGPLAAVSSTTTPRCPYYDIVIRTTVALTSGIPGDVSDFNNVAFKAEDFPRETAVTIPVPTMTGTSANIVMGMEIGSSADIVGYYANGTTPSTTQAVPSGGKFTLPVGTRWLKMTRHAGPDSGIRIAYMESCNASVCSMGRGFSVAEVTGYAGGTSVRYMIELHAYGNTAVDPDIVADVPYIYQTATYLDKLGALRP